jgi:hypothetical protein
MIRAVAIDKDTVHVEISSQDFRVIKREKEALKSAIKPKDMYWNGKVWVIHNPREYLHIWYIDHALRKVMKQLELA